MIAYLLLLAAAPHPAPDRDVPAETVIHDAVGLRDWTRGSDADVLFVRDRRERWYRIRTTGPCPNTGTLDTLTYTTDTTGTFDRFSRLRFLRTPEVSCGVASIVASAPPPGRHGVGRHR